MKSSGVESSGWKIMRRSPDGWLRRHLILYISFKYHYTHIIHYTTAILCYAVLSFPLLCYIGYGFYFILMYFIDAPSRSWCRPSTQRGLFICLIKSDKLKSIKLFFLTFVLHKFIILKKMK